MDTEQQAQLSAELKQKVSELVSHFARTHQTRIGRRYEYRGFNHAIIEHGISNLLATEIQRAENRAAELKLGDLTMAVTPDPWERYEYEGTIDEHIEWYREKLEQGLEENPQEEPMVVQFVVTPDMERTICVVGNGPSSRDNAQFIARAHEMEGRLRHTIDMVADLRDAFLQAVPEYRDERLNEMVGSPDAVLGHVTEYFRRRGINDDWNWRKQ